MTQALTLQNMMSLLPLLITSATAVVVMMAIAIRRHHWWNATITVIGLNLALGSLYFAFKAGPQLITPLFIVDGFTLFFTGLVLVGTLASATLCNAYIEHYKGNKEEIYLLLVIAAVGALVLLSARHMAGLFIGLEIMSVAMYGLVAYTYQRARSLEAAIKYMILSATASSLMLFGMALLYAQYGTLSFGGLGEQMFMAPMNLIATAGALLILAGLAFKLSLAPFHLWTPDVYEGAPAPIGAFLATVGKVAVFAVFYRFLLTTPAMHNPMVIMTLSVLAVLSIFVGNLLALQQNNLKRMMGYSSIAHFGYIMIAILAAGSSAGEAMGFYLTAYTMTSLGTFGAITLMSSPANGRDSDMLQDYRGLFWRRPLLSATLTTTFLSLAGIPLTVGFIAKFYVAAFGVAAGAWWLMAALVIGSAISLYYYLRVMVTLFLAEPGMTKYDAPNDWGQKVGGLMVLGLLGLVILLGVYPDPLMTVLQLAKVIPVP